MPKVRVAVLSLIDAQKHINVFRARMNKSQDYELVNKVDEILMSLHLIIKRLPLEDKSISDKQLDNAIALISKEPKKKHAKLDLLAVLKHIHSANTATEAVNIGRSYELDNGQIERAIKAAKPDTNLGKYTRKNQLRKQTPIPISPEPIVSAELPDDDTIISEPISDNDIRETVGI